MYTGHYLQSYDEGTNLYSDIESITVPLNPMQAYALWVSSSNTAIYVGALNTGVINRPLTRNNQGWNLVGNPYPSSIDWDAATGWTKTNVNNAICIENDGGWATYIGGGAAIGSGLAILLALGTAYGGAKIWKMKE